MIAKIDVQNTQTDMQNRTIEALRALSKENVRKPTYSQVAQTGTIPPNEAQQITVSASPKEFSVPQSALHDERAVSIDTGRAKIDFSAIKEKLQQGIDKVGVTKGLKIQVLRPGPGTRIEVISENKTQAGKARKNTQHGR
jgi:DNA-directed RNA polymerase specialized sigma subunit